MENTFNFKASEVVITKPEGSGDRVQYAKPGVYDFQIISWDLKKATNGSMFIEEINITPAGEQVARQYWLNSTVSPGKTKSALSVSAESMKKKAIMLGKETEYNAINATSQDEFAQKTGALFIGAKYRGKAKGKEVEKRDGGKFIKSEMSDAFESINIPISQTKLTFDPMRDIKMLPVGFSVTSDPILTLDDSGLPF